MLAISMRLRTIMKALSAYDDDDEVVFVSGNALTNNKMWMRMTGRCLNRTLCEVVVNAGSVEREEATSRGVARALVYFTDLPRRMSKPKEASNNTNSETVVTLVAQPPPDAKKEADYEKAFALHSKLHALMTHAKL